MVRYMDTKDFIKDQLQEMFKHKWIESEKVGYDLGEEAMLDWVEKHSQSGKSKKKRMTETVY